MAKIDLTNFENKLNALTGYDMEAAERIEIETGNTALVVTSSKGFYARIAAFALEVPVDEIKSLPIRQYSRLTTKVAIFLNRGSDEEETDLQQSEKLQSTSASGAE